MNAGSYREESSSEADRRSTEIHLHKRAGFRVVGRRERIGSMNGVWRDVLLLERRSTIAGA
jgi:phosphinothricin acetyltransferase